MTGLRVLAVTVAAVVTGLTAGHAVTSARGDDDQPAAQPVSMEQRLRDQLAVERTRHAAETRVLRSQLASRTSVASAIATASVVYGVPASEIRSVAWCESRLHATAVGRTPVGRERAVGLMQWLPSSFSRTPYGRAGLSPFDPYVSAMAAAQTVKKEGWRQWACKP